MNADELRALQAPWKERFRAQPTDAYVTLSAVGRVHFDDVSVEIVRSRPLPTRMGLHPLAGGDGAQACAAETLLEALVGCAGVTLAAVCTSLGISPVSATLTAAGQLDFRGTLGISKESPVGFQDLLLTFELESNASDELLAKAVHLAERYCVVARTLPGVRTAWRRLDQQSAESSTVER